MAEEQFQNIQFQETLPKKSKTKNLILILVLVLLLGFTGVLASRTWDPLWNPFRPSPEEVINKMMLGFPEIKSLEEKIELLIVARNEAEISLQMDIEGKTDNHQEENPKFEQKFNISFSIADPKETSIGAKFALGGEIKELEKEFYLKFTILPTIPFLEMPRGTNISQIKDQWIKIDQDSVKEFIKEMAGKEWTPEMERMLAEEMERQALSQKEIQNKIKEMLSGSEIYLVKKEFPDEKIADTKVYHYLVGLDKNKILQIIQEIWKETEEAMLEKYGISPTFDENELREILDKLGEIEGEMWIGKKDYFPYRINLEKTLDLSKFEEEGTILFNLNIENSGFNQPVKIETLSEYKSLKEILIPLFEQYGGFLGDSNIEEETIPQELEFPLQNGSDFFQASILENFLRLFKR